VTGDKRVSHDPSFLVDTIRPVAVVVSYYDARPVDNLVALLWSMRTIAAGWPYQVRIVVNQDRPKSLSLPSSAGLVEVHYRRNTGYNIGAWEAGWRIAPAFDSFLFLQDECRVIRENWIAAFVKKAADPSVGLVGECLSTIWDASWDTLAERTRGERFRDHLIDGRPADRVPCYLHFLRAHGVQPGTKGDHLQSLVLFAQRQVLESIGGFPIGRNYGEAIAAEIGISKKVQWLGKTVCEVGPVPFTYIEHPQWLHRRGGQSSRRCCEHA
jgi:hypothetical protein